MNEKSIKPVKTIKHHSQIEEIKYILKTHLLLAYIIRLEQIRKQYQ